jgi:hypothetical protein
MCNENGNLNDTTLNHIRLSTGYDGHLQNFIKVTAETAVAWLESLDIDIKKKN